MSVIGIFKDITDSGPNRALVRPITYRPFDTRFTYYTGRSRGMMGWPVDRVMRHMLVEGNLGLSTTRSVETGEYSHVYTIDKLSTHHTVSIKEVNYSFPLWLLSEDGAQERTRIPNLSPVFLEALAQTLGRHAEPSGLPENTTPDDVLAYCYAVLHAPSYRNRYTEFLKGDFPRIPLAAVAGSELSFAEIWDALIPLGRQLIDLHVLKDLFGEKSANFPKQGGNEVGKPRYEPPREGQPGRVWINATQYFEGIEPETWVFKIGGYQVCEKWLKDRKGRILDFNDIQHYGKIIAALTQTRALMAQIDSAANGRLWPRSGPSTEQD
ncbi:MAG: type ISP restriction/modification enzyme [Thiobacillus sp.]